jgi:uncharacterized membrane protein
MTPSYSLSALVAALGCGLNAGVFFAFSSFVMPALSRLPPQQGIAAMQSVNAAAINVWFMGALFGTAALCVLVALGDVLRWGTGGVPLRLAGSLLYLVGAILLTVVFHVPRNKALASISPESAGAASIWRRYVQEWTAGNHVRAAASLLAAALLTVAWRMDARG